MYYCMINPTSRSGKGLKKWIQLENMFQERGLKYQAVKTTKPGDATRLTRSLMERHQDEVEPVKLIVIGGDGTMNEVINGITDFDKILVGYIPGGSASDFALGLDMPSDYNQLIESISKGDVVRTTDIGEIVYNHTGSDLSRLHDDNIESSRRFDVSSGIGFDAAVCEEALNSRMKKALNKIGMGKLTYLILALHQLLGVEKLSMDIETDVGDTLHMDHALFAAAMIHRFEGGGFRFCPDADYDDGLLDLFAVGDIPIPKQLIALPLAKSGHHMWMKGMHSFRCKEIRIRTASPLWVHTDGEVSVKSDDITIRCTDQKLKLLD